MKGSRRGALRARTCASPPGPWSTVVASAFNSSPGEASPEVSGREISDEPRRVHETAALVATLAERYQVSREAIVLGWLMRHPATIQPLIGTLHPGRIRASSEATRVTLDRDDWYALYVAARGRPLP